ncbi:MAG: hypothetical protein NTX86_02640 [Candidatus Dependentiae bacterium]|nr:hypothetical protein [Candidatus Dependentiae bacterium]
MKLYLLHTTLALLTTTNLYAMNLQQKEESNKKSLICPTMNKGFARDWTVAEMANADTFFEKEVLKQKLKDAEQLPTCPHLGLLVAAMRKIEKVERDRVIEKNEKT